MSECHRSDSKRGLEQELAAPSSTSPTLALRCSPHWVDRTVSVSRIGYKTAVTTNGGIVRKAGRSAPPPPHTSHENCRRSALEAGVHLSRARSLNRRCLRLSPLDIAQSGKIRREGIAQDAQVAICQIQVQGRSGTHQMPRIIAEDRVSSAVHKPRLQPRFPNRFDGRRSYDLASLRIFGGTAGGKSTNCLPGLSIASHGEAACSAERTKSSVRSWTCMRMSTIRTCLPTRVSRK